MKTVPLGGQKAAGRVALVDDEDYDLVTQYRWRVWEYQQDGRVTKGPYAISGRGMRMHALIMGRTWIDHIDHDGLNNQRSNLRPATNTENQHNARSLCGSSQYKGVTWLPRRRRWRAAIGDGGGTHYLGLFSSEIDAALAYDAAAREKFGTFAYLNFPGETRTPIRAQPRRAGRPRGTTALRVHLAAALAAPAMRARLRPALNAAVGAHPRALMRFAT